MSEFMEQEFSGMCHSIRQRIEDCVIEVARSMQAPHLLYKAELSKDGDQWCWLYGENLQEGVAGFGDTPAQAAIAFDREWGFFK